MNVVWRKNDELKNEIIVHRSKIRSFVLLKFHSFLCSYLNREPPKLPVVQATSKSRSASPVDSTPVKEKIEFITAFGDDDAAKNELKRKRPFEKSLLDECRDAKKKAEPVVIPIRTRRLVTPPPLPSPT